VTALIYLFLCALPIALIWAFVDVFRPSQPNASLRLTFGTITIAAGVVAFLTTYRYDYYANKNTHVFGWPIPIVIFQRADADAAWLDYIGWTAFGAYPINLALFMFIPSIIFVVLARLSRRRYAHKVEPITGANAG
jgi:hypothetical protein